MMSRLTSAAALIVALTLSGCGASLFHGDAESAPNPRYAFGMAPPLKHVFVMVLENEEYQASGNTSYLARLAKKGATATHFYAITHPSLPNYIAMLAGSTLGVTADTFSGVLHQRTLVDQMNAHGLTWRAYMQDLPSACYMGDAIGTYVRRHDPFLYFASIRKNPSLCDRVQPLTALNEDLSNGPISNFSWISPGLCSDGHDCGSSSVDAFLRSIVPRITASLAYRDHGALFILYDEGTTDDSCCRKAHGGHIALIALGPGIRGGTKITATADQYSLLRTIEDGFRLKHLKAAGCSCTSTLAQAWSK